MENPEEKQSSLVVMPKDRADGTIALRLFLEQGELPPALLKTILEIMDRYGVTLRATMSQRVNIENIKKDDLEDIVLMLGATVGMQPGVVSCPGGHVCKFGVLPTRQLARDVLATIQKHGPYPHKVKAGISGCGMGCGMSAPRDIGLIAAKDGWSLYFGGVGTRDARPGVMLGERLSEAEVLRLLEHALEYYKANGKTRERTGKMLTRLGDDVVAGGILEACSKRA